MGGRDEVAAKKKAPEKDPEKLDRVRLAKRSLHYALRRGRWIALRFRNNALAQSGVAAEAAAEAIASLFGGTRRWDPVKVPDPMQHIRSTINSVLWNRAVGADQSKPHDDIDDVVLRDDVDPETLIISKEQALWEKHVHERVMELVLEDEELLAVYSCVEREGTGKPAVIAAKLNISTREVDKRKRRLNDLCGRVLRELANVKTNRGQS